MIPENKDTIDDHTNLNGPTPAQWGRYHEYHKQIQANPRGYHPTQELLKVVELCKRYKNQETRELVRYTHQQVRYNHQQVRYNHQHQR